VTTEVTVLMASHRGAHAHGSLNGRVSTLQFDVTVTESDDESNSADGEAKGLHMLTAASMGVSEPCNTNAKVTESDNGSNSADGGVKGGLHMLTAASMGVSAPCNMNKWQ
jgi:hypothetical protein